tara:strand:+ start:535 stop:909 length:375 start_codon:yes stop_codon:yes gene_type:complete
MPNLSLFFSTEINISAAIGDIVYYTPTSTVSEFSVSQSIVRLGKIKQIEEVTSGPNKGDYKIVCHVDSGVEYPNTTTDFILFAKDNIVNSGSVLGYYSELTFINDSNEEFELYSVNFEVTESSK